MQTLPTRRLTDQLRLFPRAAASPRDIDLHAVSHPAREFTGDFYFTHRVGDVLWLVLGDVAGKGLKAAVIMAMIQEQLEERIVACSATADCDPAVMMTRLHLTLRDLLPENRFATAIIARIHDRGRIAVANAGHCPLLIARRDGSIETIGSTGPVVGILPSAEWRSIEIPFGRGDALLAYTDGVTEARDGSGGEFGMCRVRDAFARGAAHSTTSRGIVEAVESALHAFAEHVDDDVTVVAARR